MKKVLLLILDGWGIGKKDSSDAIFQALTPYIDSLEKTCPSATLKTFGENVGLPEGQMGNSEVGHMNIGAGRVVWQMLVRINKTFKSEQASELSSIKKLVELAQLNKNRKIHLMGLVSDGGVHSSMEHLLNLTALLAANGLDDRTYVHAFTDGRDTDPQNGIVYLSQVINDSRFGHAHLASICGRYYAMDRDKRWERTKVAYDALTQPAITICDLQTAMQQSYDNGITDEFVQPIFLENHAPIAEDDILLCFNFRTDRGRQISEVLTQRDMPEFGMNKMNVHYFTMTEYDKTYSDVSVLFQNEDLKNTLGEVLAANDKTQLRAAETEKYPHVTFFFNGGREQPFAGESRVMASSPKVATYDLQPEMSAQELTDKVLVELKTNYPDFACVNFANPDMVGHTGVFDAIKLACETVDGCSKELVTTAQELGYSVIVIADHGNADKAVNEDGTPHTAHTTNLVPIYILDKNVGIVKDGKLADIAPTVLSLMGVAKNPDMDGDSLI